MSARKKNFNWDDAKTDKYKEYFLGNSLKTMPKWTFNGGKTNSGWWLGKSQQGQETAEARRAKELDAIKKLEEEMMLEELGQKPKKKRAVTNKLDKDEILKLTRRGETREENDIDNSGIGCETRADIDDIMPGNEPITTNIGTVDINANISEMPGKSGNESENSSNEDEKAIKSSEREHKHKHKHKEHKHKHKEHKHKDKDKDKDKDSHKKDKDKKRKKERHRHDSDDDEQSTKRQRAE